MSEGTGQPDYEAPEWPRWVKPALACCAGFAVLVVIGALIGPDEDSADGPSPSTTAPSTTTAPVTTEAAPPAEPEPSSTEAPATTERPTTTTEATTTTTEVEPTEEEVWLDRVRDVNSNRDIEILDVEISGSVLRITTDLGYAPDDPARRGMAAGVCFDVVFETDWTDDIEVRANNGGVLAWTGAYNDGCRGFS